MKCHGELKKKPYMLLTEPRKYEAVKKYETMEKMNYANTRPIENWRDNYTLTG